MNRIQLSLRRAQFSLQLDVQLPDQGITVILGSSGAGKTSLLRCVAGLDRADQARIEMGGVLWQDDQQGVFVPTWQRALGYVFQEASLLPHLTVKQNLTYGLKRIGSRTPMHSLAQAIELLGIGHLLERSPAGLSGGERQRVALARALASQPRILLLDEPMASLDAARRQEILPWLEKMRDELHLPMLYVTHAANEAARLGAHMLVLEHGRVQAQGTVSEVFANIDQALGAGEDMGALLQGTLVERHADWHLCRIAFDGGELWLRDSGLAVGQSVRMRLLARDVSVATVAPQHTSIQNLLSAVIEAVADDDHPSQVLVRLRVGPSAVLSRITQRAWAQLGLQVGQQVFLQVKTVALVA
ncbi:MAG: molybdenum ABC transporter ATP-binding protein [Betaproteobacteria bacterium]|jgi:molybdate transport system ATP-binding protein|nr:molybdenum ABC transporter ATP-binding protein [Betaproteobacteria bacterium]